MFPFLIILILGASYSLTIAPALTWVHFSADGGDLISAAATGGVPHPSGYPLYLILARAFQWLPFGELAFRTNLLSTVCTILTALILYVYLMHQLRDRPSARFASFLATLAYGLAPFIWGQALVTEVYALHGLLMMLCIYVLSLAPPKFSDWMRGFVFGIAAANHLTAILIFPLLALGSEGKLFAPISVLLKRGLGLAIGLSLYLSLPIRAYFDPPINWGDASTLQGFFWLVSGQIYQQYPFSPSLADIVQRLRAFAGLVLQQYTWLGALLGLYGLISPPSRRTLIPTLWMGIVFLLFAIFYGSYDSQVNLLPVWLAFAIWLAYGLQDLLGLLPEASGRQTAIAGLLFLAILLRIPFVFSSVDASQDLRAQDFIKRAMQEIPRNSLVFVEGDEQIFSLWYAQFGLNQRLDMVVVAQGLLPYPWYQDTLRDTYADINMPQANALQPAELVVANPGRAVCHILHAEPIICAAAR
ncbi:MAG: DUF2723 domain-containing protein [Anaerolineaceae bacterium]|nr:MAG: DUF2723 domain-containing protein [Anaerolineaceae bacterium]